MSNLNTLRKLGPSAYDSPELRKYFAPTLKQECPHCGEVTETYPAYGEEALEECPYCEKSLDDDRVSEARDEDARLDTLGEIAEREIDYRDLAATLGVDYRLDF